VPRKYNCAFRSFVMNHYSQPPPGKISEHGNGIGAPSPEEVERRAREIAIIDERNPDEFTEADWAQARHELMGEENNVPPEETPDNAEMTEVSPTKWHLAHTTWFFETFILKKFVPGYRAEIPEYAYLFNSYYNAAGDMHRRNLRGLISRPTVSEAQRYRESIDSHIDDLLSNADEKLLDEIEPLLVLGVHHEQQHQELLITDIKHVFV